MSTTRAPARVFSGSEILRALQDALDALEPEAEITEFHAGENMQITFISPCTMDDGVVVGFNTSAWDGEKWEVIGWD